ncbi:putative microtubule-severing ATPase [Lupinus albus]|uniref:Putative microtubule-severing ATPase n=1 Tax=Lupinus albus TaxID=3870 RepID=A0A6A4QRC8_LUPAL|nr:putative microtubule-severing ATPase [Lupinus albus]
MYFSRIQGRYRRWASVLQPCFFRPRLSGHAGFQSLSPKTTLKECTSHGSIIRRHLFGSDSLRCASSKNSCLGLDKRPTLWSTRLRAYSSDSGGRNASEDKHVHVNDRANLDIKCCNAHSHARIGEQDQEEWLNNEKLSIESKKRESPFLTRRDKFKNEFLRRIVPWEKINISWDTFPYHINEHTKNLLVECAASHLRHNKFASSFGSRLTSSSGRILLQSIPGTELYRERVVRALAQDLQVPLLVLDCSIIAPYDMDDDLSDYESDDDNADSGEEGSIESENEDDNDASNEEEWASSTEVKSDASDNDDAIAHAEAALKKVKAAVQKLVPYNIEEFEKIASVGSESSDSSKSSDAKSSDKSGCQLRKGDRVKYIGPSVQVTADDRPLTSGQRGEVYEMNEDQDRVAVILDINEDSANEGEVENLNDGHRKPAIYWIHVKDVEKDLDAQAQDCYIAVEALCEVLKSRQPLIVYFPDSSQWLHKSVPKSNRKEFFHKVEEMFDKLCGPVVLICGQNRVQSGSKEKEQFTMILPNFGRVAKLPLSLKRLTDGFKGAKSSEDDEIYKLFSNVLCVHPPKDDNLLVTFKKQLDEDRKIVISRSNLNELRKVLEEHQLSCTDLLHVNTDDVILTKQKAEKVVGWAKNHYLSSCLLPSVKGERLWLPRESLEIAISRMKGQETLSRKPSQNLKSLAKDEFESNFISAVVPSDEIGVKFDDIGALEDVKMTLNELVILPMRRPELFSRGNLLRPCKGILLFGPPGTGKTLLAKALATEAGANFISITGSTLTSKWFGDAEKLTKALFSFASKLAPVIIFVDEVDSLLGARGGSFEHEATRRMRNEFMAAWDGLRSKENQRILILGATNRPFDLDDAVIRRLPRRIYIDLPDAENRMKILRIVLAQESLVPDFEYDELAKLTEGYSGSDLKNLCIAAAYRPVQELIEEEKKGGNNGIPSVLRALNLDDFVESKAKVGPSVAYDATSMNELRKWNEMYGEGGSRTKSPFGFGS